MSIPPAQISCSDCGLVTIVMVISINHSFKPLCNHWSSQDIVQMQHQIPIGLTMSWSSSFHPLLEYFHPMIGGNGGVGFLLG